VIVATATTYTVTTQETSLRPPRSAAIVGRAVARIIWSITAGSIARTIAAKRHGERRFACLRTGRRRRIVTAADVPLYTLSINIYQVKIEQWTSRQGFGSGRSSTRGT